MPRLSIPVDDRLFNDMKTLLPWGTQAAVIRKVCALLVDQIKKDGVIVVELLMNDQYVPLPRGERKEKLL